jgi:hypothetical protein
MLVSTALTRLRPSVGRGGRVFLAATGSRTQRCCPPTCQNSGKLAASRNRTP